MKTFEEICYMSQSELKEYLAKYLRSKGYKVANENGFLYAKAKEDNPVRVLLVAHMDTVHKERIEELEKVPYDSKHKKNYIWIEKSILKSTWNRIKGSLFQ